MQAAELARAAEAAERRIEDLSRASAERLQQLSAERDLALQALVDRDLDMVSAALTSSGSGRGFLSGAGVASPPRGGAPARAEVEALRRELEAAQAARAAAEAAAEAAKAEVRSERNPLSLLRFTTHFVSSRFPDPLSLPAPCSC